MIPTLVKVLVLSKHAPGPPGRHSPQISSAEPTGVEPVRPCGQALFENAAAANYRLGTPPN